MQKSNTNASNAHARTYTESASIDRDRGAISYSAAGVNNVPLCIKWMLVFEEPETRTLWLAKAVPRDWLVPGEAPLVVNRATTRYGRISFQLSVLPSSTVDTSYKVKANVTLPASFSIAGSSPAGGLRLRIRAPLAHAGKLSAVTVGGKPWTNFDASTETVDFKVSDLTSEMLSVGLPMIVVEFSTL